MSRTVDQNLLIEMTFTVSFVRLPGLKQGEQNTFLRVI